MHRRHLPALPALLALLLALAACTAEGGGGSPTASTSSGSAAMAAAPTPAHGAPVAEGITVEGVGRITDEPDTLRATVGVEVVRPDVDTAFADAAEAAERVLAALRDGGVAEEDLTTTELSVQPQYDHQPEGRPVITGYVVRNLVEATVRDVDGAGDLLAAVTEAGGDDARVQGLRFALEENAEQLASAREAAFDDARAKAEDYARLAGVELGDLLGVTEVAADPPAPAGAQEMADAGGAAAAGAPIQPGQQEVGVRIQARWALR